MANKWPNAQVRADEHHRLKTRIEEWLRLHNVQGAWLTLTSGNVLALTFTNESDCSMFVIAWSEYDEIPWSVVG